MNKFDYILADIQSLSEDEKEKLLSLIIKDASTPKEVVELNDDRFKIDHYDNLLGKYKETKMNLLRVKENIKLLLHTYLKDDENSNLGTNDSTKTWAL
jgi:GDP-D-mannose dehydratase